MKEREIFGIVLRIIGLLGVLYVVRHWAILYHKTGHIHFDQPWKLLAECCLILIGLYMIRGAPLFLQFMCPEDQDKKDKDKKDT